MRCMAILVLVSSLVALAGCTDPNYDSDATQKWMEDVSRTVESIGNTNWDNMKMFD